MTLDPQHPQPGIWPGVSFDVYCAIDAVNCSSLKAIDRSPLHYLAVKNNRSVQTPAQRLGSLAHLRVLEPERFRREVMAGPGENKGLAPWKHFAKYIAKLNTMGGPIQLHKQSEIDHAERIAEQVFASDDVGMFDGGASEVTLIADIDVGGVLVRCKCRVDYLNVCLMLDLKTCEDARKERFMWDVYKWKYHVKSAFYTDILQVLKPDDNLLFCFAACEKSDPHAVQVHRVKDRALRLGRFLYMGWLTKLAKCIEDDHYPGYAPGVKTIGLPDKAYPKGYDVMKGVMIDG